MNRRILVTGGAGFIGSALCRFLVTHLNHYVVNVDKLTYAANLSNLAEIERHKNYKFYQQDILNRKEIAHILEAEKIDAIMHLAAESHVDRSLEGAENFIHTNILGTYELLEAARNYWENLEQDEKNTFRFHHISTDEVFGDLPFDDSKFNENSRYNPSSPYAASKAASDHLVRAWGHSYNMPVIVSNCSNNYGPFQFPEKLIPLMILEAMRWKKLPVYGDGKNVRDWLHVEDHAEALALILEKGQIGKTYNVGGNEERNNLTVVEMICDMLDRLDPSLDGRCRRELISFVTDRKGHDRRYAIDASVIRTELGWKPRYNFNTGLAQTVEWYFKTYKRNAA